MIKFNEVSLVDSAFHQVGNQILGGKLLLATEGILMSEEKENKLLNYFVHPFNSAREIFHFENSIDLKLNVAYNICDQIFDDGDFVELTGMLAKHLYSQTRHSAIKSGELFVGLLNGIVYEDTLCKGVVILKSERKSNYISVKEDAISGIDIVKGIQLDKIDKACLVLNMNYHDGFRVFTYEHNGADTEYWRRDFLSVGIVDGPMKQTADLIKLCNEFSHDYVYNRYGKKEQIEFLTKSFDFLSKAREVEVEGLFENLLDRDIDKLNFKERINGFLENNEINRDKPLTVSYEVVKVEKRRLKSEIKLDTMISIKINSVGSASVENFIEQGFDKNRNMKFYKVYYNEEF